MPAADDEHAWVTAEAAARRSYGKLVAYLARRTGDVAGAEDALSDAFAAALLDWPAHGVPDRPEAWLMAVARRKTIDAARRRRSSAQVAGHIQLISDELQQLESADRIDIPDDRLALMFVCAHPAIDPTIRSPLMLQTVLGFDAATIASAFLVSPATMSQRLVRAKHKIREAGISFQMPERADLASRLDAVLAAIYAAFAEGWSDPASTETRRRNLGDEGIWLGRLVASLLPEEPEALGLLALMLHAEARRGARRNGQGDYVPLAEQDPSTWNDKLINEAEALLRKASHTGMIGRYQIEAAVQSAHAARRISGQTDWAAIARMYDALLAITESPVVAINRATAIAETDGAAVGLAALDALADDRRLADYQPFWAARAGLLRLTGDVEAADKAYERAIGLEADPAVRRFLQQRRAELRR